MIRPRTDEVHDSTRTIARSGNAHPLGAVVRVLSAQAAPERFRLARGKCVLGAGAGADIVIQDDAVSRSHVELELVAEGVRVTDLGSRNGTFYLGHRVGEMVLALGSRLRLGTVEVSLDADVEALEAGAATATTRYGGLLGSSPPMRALFAVLARLEGSLVNVLLEGESGSGKELVARAIHEGSVVAARPLIVVNCGAIARELVLSELFGHKRGAFTGATADRMGAFDAADGGTLFLDELGELPLEAQPTLLRALESGEIRPVGTTETRRVKVRIVAATNRDLQEEVRAGRFREDLYYRLAVVKLVVPPLRDRAEDIPELAAHFASAAGVPSLPHDVIALLETKAWPGNARELRNAVEAYLAVGTLPGTGRAEEEEFEAALRKLIDVDKPYADLKEDFLHRFTKKYLELLLAKTSANQSEAARVSGLDRSYLGRMLVRYGVSKG